MIFNSKKGRALQDRIFTPIKVIFQKSASKYSDGLKKIIHLPRFIFLITLALPLISRLMMWYLDKITSVLSSKYPSKTRIYSVLQLQGYTT